MHVHVTSYMYILQYIQSCRRLFIVLLPPQILLAYSDGNHYDSVYTIQHKSSTALCQGEQTVDHFVLQTVRGSRTSSVSTSVCMWDSSILYMWYHTIVHSKSTWERAARVRACNSNTSPSAGQNYCKNRTPCHMLSNNGLCLCIVPQYLLLFFGLAVNSDRFQILMGYMVLLKLPILMCSCDIGMHKVCRSAI